MQERIPHSIAAEPSIAPRVAVLEDDSQLRDAILVPGLRDFGFDSTGAATAAELYRHMLRQSFDLVVLDIGLPGEDGLSVMKHLRELSNLGIVMLTGNRSRMNCIFALSHGADAYLSKPTDLEVLAATLHSVARRIVNADHGPPKTVVTTHHWQLDTDGWCLVSPKGNVVALTMPERILLTQLIAAQGSPVSREALIASLTQEDIYHFDPHRLEMMIHRLRRKICKNTDEAPPLLTVRGTGYLFVTGRRHSGKTNL
ncbi:response regulator transcription factor [Dyella tabacisoli]|uniref:DNA-binding response regulator n=1 Tax=Dyella tabacisoli TaxID=2282381 RepID=A0A369UI98_9GAMM|nr:response regulator transcription factor [Dyella tabacisoli]RDD80474.1 DNA-binding response regulator [Dyella tabacisoli]